MKNRLELEEDEEILFLTKKLIGEEVRSNFYLGTCAVPIALVLITGFLSLVILTVIIIFLWLISFIFVSDEFFKYFNHIYYITSKRIVEIKPRGFFPKRFKRDIRSQEEIRLDDISHVEINPLDESWIIIYSKSENDNFPYNGSETSRIHDLSQKKIIIYIDDIWGDEIVEFTLVSLIKLIPLQIHPNLKGLYFKSF